jgi:hypothetical protein
VTALQDQYALPGWQIGQTWRIRLPFTEPPITANEARSKVAFWAQAKAKKEVAEAVLACVKAARVPPMERVAATLTWYAPDFIPRDPDGLYVMLKAVMDALTPPRAAIPKGTPTKTGTPRKKDQAAKLGAGIIRDDNALYVESVTCRILLGQADARVELELVPLAPLPPRPKAQRKR